MGKVDQTGNADEQTTRSGITGDDAAVPSGATPVGSIAVPQRSKGALTHVLLIASGSGTGVACRVTIFGLLSGNWYVLAQLNDGATITRTTKTPVANGNNINYAESFAHLSYYERLYPLIDATASLASGGVSINFGFEVG